MRLSMLGFAILLPLSAADERSVEPTWLYRSIAAAPRQASGISGKGCHYQPLFGEGDKEARIVRGVSRYGVVTVEPGGASAVVNYPREEEVYVVLEGEGTLLYGGKRLPLRKDDFAYLPPGIPHGLVNASRREMKLILMGFRVPKNIEIHAPAEPAIASITQAKKQVVGKHPPTTLYQLLMGDRKSTRDLLATGHVLTSLFIMEFAPSGTNFPHHHPREEEIYLLLDGEGDMVAGGGMNGVEGRHPAKAGDAYFFRMNCTVGFYNPEGASAKTSRILAVRSLYPAQ